MMFAANDGSVARQNFNRFRGFGVLTPSPRNFAISIGLAGRSYNRVSTAVLHCQDRPAYGDSKISRGQSPKTPEPIGKKIGVGDYVGDDSRMPKFKTNTPLRAWLCMRKISPSAWFLVFLSYPILFCDLKILLATRD